MKRISLLLLGLVCAAVCLCSVCAAEKTVFLAAGGTGDGTSAESPVGTVAAAYAALGNDGGTVVITNDFTVNNASALAFPAHTEKVKLTGVYGDTDYGAQLHLTGTAFVSFNGPTELDGLTVKLDKASAGLAANFHPLRIGYHVTVSAPNNAYALYLLAGQNNNTSIPVLGDGQTSTVEVYSGKYIMAGAFSRTSVLTHTGKVTFTLGGTADVRDFYFGALTAGAKGGSCDLYMQENAKVTNMYLSGNTTGMTGSIALYMADKSAVTNFKYYDKSYFPNGTKSLVTYGAVTLPASVGTYFDSVSEAPTDVRYLSGDGGGNGIAPFSPAKDLKTAVGGLTEGGTAVIVGDLPVNNASALALPACTGKVILTSVFDGTDYRESGAQLRLTGTAFLSFGGPAELDGLTIALDKADAGIAANFHPMRIGYDVTVSTPNSGAGHGLFLLAGQNNNTSVPALGDGQTAAMEVYSGKYLMAGAFSRISALVHTGKVTITLGGTADVRDFYCGALSTGAKGGSCDLFMKENAKVTNLYLSGNTVGMTGSVMLDLTDDASVGTFKNTAKTYFPDGTRTLRITGTPSVSAAFDSFDRICKDGGMAEMLSDGRLALLAPLSSLGYAKAGFALTLDGTQKTFMTDTVYESITDGKDTFTAASFGETGYLVGILVEDVPAFDTWSIALETEAAE